MHRLFQIPWCGATERIICRGSGEPSPQGRPLAFGWHPPRASGGGNLQETTGACRQPSHGTTPQDTQGRERSFLDTFFQAPSCFQIRRSTHGQLTALEPPFRAGARLVVAWRCALMRRRSHKLRRLTTLKGRNRRALHSKHIGRAHTLPSTVRLRVALSFHGERSQQVTCHVEEC